MSTGHQHGRRGHGSESRGRLAGVIVINAAGFVLEFVGGMLFGSVALMSDAVHMLFDAMAYLSAFVAAHVAETREGSEYLTFGLHRVETFSAILNGVLLIPMAGLIIWQAYERYLAPMAIDVVPTLAVAVAGLIVNVGSVYWLQGESQSLNERGAFYHLLGDAAGSVAVIVGTLVIAVTGVRVIDPFVAVLIALLVLRSSITVLNEGIGILLQRSAIPPDALREAVAEIEGVKAVTDVKSWQVCSQLDVCTLHVELSVRSMDAVEEIRTRIEDRLHERFGIDELTIQFETPDQ